MKNRYLWIILALGAAIIVYQRSQRPVVTEAPAPVSAPKKMEDEVPTAQPKSATIATAPRESALEAVKKVRSWCQFRGPQNEIILPKNLLKLLWKRREGHFVYSKADLPCLRAGTSRVLFYEVDDLRTTPTYFVMEAELKVSNLHEFESIQKLNDYVNKSATPLNLVKTISEFSSSFPYFVNRPPVLLATVSLVKKSWHRTDFGVPIKSPLYRTIANEADLRKILKENTDSNVVFLTSPEDQSLIGGGRSHYLNIPELFHSLHINEMKRNTPDYDGLIKQLRLNTPVILMGENPGDRALETVASVLREKKVESLYIYRPGVEDLTNNSWQATSVNGIKMLKFNDVRQIFARNKSAPIFVDVRPRSRIEIYNLAGAIMWEDFLKRTTSDKYILIGASDYDPAVKKAMQELPEEKKASVEGFLRGGYEELSQGLWLSRIAPHKNKNKKPKKQAGLSKMKELKYAGPSSGRQNRRMGLRLKEAERKALKKRGLAKREQNEAIFLAPKGTPPGK